MEKFAKMNKIAVLGKIPYNKNFLDSSIKMKPVVEIDSSYSKLFKQIISKIKT